MELGLMLDAKRTKEKKMTHKFSAFSMLRLGYKLWIGKLHSQVQIGAQKKIRNCALDESKTNNYC